MTKKIELNNIFKEQRNELLLHQSIRVSNVNTVNMMKRSKGITMSSSSGSDPQPVNLQQRANSLLHFLGSTRAMIQALQLILLISSLTSFSSQLLLKLLLLIAAAVPMQLATLRMSSQEDKQKLLCTGPTGLKHQCSSYSRLSEILSHAGYLVKFSRIQNFISSFHWNKENW